MRKALRTTATILLLAVALCSAAAIAAGAAGGGFTVNDPYVDPETGYKAVIDDQAELLTAKEELDLQPLLTELTKTSNIAVYTVDSVTNMQDYERAKNERISLFSAEDSAVFMIDMYLRRIYIGRKGNMEAIFTDAVSNNITNNIAKYATKSDYGECFRIGLSQMLDRVNSGGANTPKPMKYLSNAVISVMLALLGAFTVAVLTSSTYSRKKTFASYEGVVVSNVKQRVTGQSKKYSPLPKGNGGGGGSSCSSCGGSSCSSCSSCGGSSCSSCGGSSCGGSSF